MFEDKAKSIANNPKDLSQLLKSAEEKLLGKDNIFLEIFEDMKACLRMTKLYINREYTNISTKTLVLIVFAIFYFVLPFDLIFDFIPFTGYLDDYSVIIWVFTKVKRELDEFKQWETSQKK